MDTCSIKYTKTMPPEVVMKSWKPSILRRNGNRRSPVIRAQNRIDTNGHRLVSKKLWYGLSGSVTRGSRNCHRFSITGRGFAARHELSTLDTCTSWEMSVTRKSCVAAYCPTHRVHLLATDEEILTKNHTGAIRFSYNVTLEVLKAYVRLYK